MEHGRSSIKSHLHLLLISGSAILVAIAGSFADAGESRADARTRFASAEMKSHPEEVRFAFAQIRRYDELLSNLTERAESETNEDLALRLRPVLEDLESRLMETRAFASKVKVSRPSGEAAFAVEDLRLSLIALQDAGHRAVGETIAADRASDARLDVRLNAQGQLDGTMIRPQNIGLDRGTR